jgi:small-conductance mechanosensitive channel
LGFIYYFVGLFIVKVESKPSINATIPSKTRRVWITVFIPIYYLLLYYFAILGTINFTLFIMPRLDAMLEVCSYWRIGHCYYQLLKELFAIAFDNKVKGFLDNDIEILKSKLTVTPMIRS